MSCRFLPLAALVACGATPVTGETGETSDSWCEFEVGEAESVELDRDFESEDGTWAIDLAAGWVFDYRQEHDGFVATAFFAD